MLNLRPHSSPDTAGLVRAVLGGIATAFALRPDLLNDLKTVVSEACNDAVDHAFRGDTRAIAVRVDIQLEEIEVTVRDWGGGCQPLAPADDHLRVGLPLINALADTAEFLTAPGRGTEVRMGASICATIPGRLTRSFAWRMPRTSSPGCRGAVARAATSS